MAVFAPIPSASDSTATTVNIGLLTSRRTAYRTFNHIPSMRLPQVVRPRPVDVYRHAIPAASRQ